VELVKVQLDAEDDGDRRRYGVKHAGSYGIHYRRYSNDCNTLSGDRQRVSASDDELLEWVELVAQFFARQEGLPPITGRILGWLMVCEPAEQSAAQIAAGIKASRASMTSNLRMLQTVGLVRKRTRAGDRTAYYRVDDDAWEAALRQRLEGMASFEAITERGLDLIGRDDPRSSRLHAAYDVYRWIGRVFADLEAKR
jgi:DNA-binding MarR family transcriptional regulator